MIGIVTGNFLLNKPSLLGSACKDAISYLMEINMNWIINPQVAPQAETYQHDSDDHFVVIIAMRKDHAAVDREIVRKVIARAIANFPAIDEPIAGPESVGEKFAIED